MEKPKKILNNSPGEKNNTRQSILDVAEKLFAERGYDGTSIRDIVRLAKVDNGAVYYHFGTKQKLFETVFEELAGPVIAERVRQLTECRKEAGRPPMLRQILSAYLAPGLRSGFASKEKRWRFARIRIQLLQATHPFMSDMLAKHFTVTGERFLSALSAELPHLDSQDLQWRYHTMVGAITFTMGGTGRLQLGKFAEKGKVYDPSDLESVYINILAQMESMFSAPSISSE